MSNKYSALAAMGIVNPNQINRYSLQTSGEFDVLRIIYNRDKGSLLPGSKKFKFRRTTRMVETDSVKKKHEKISEVSPALSDAITELHKIINQKQTNLDKKEIIQDEILRLEEEVNTRIKYLKSLVGSLED